MNKLSIQQVQRFRKELYAFFKTRGRHLPWRGARKTPYEILVSEVMLQQTQVPRVIIKYPEFIKKFPTIHALAKSPLARVLRVWQGMGYNRRALYLQRAAATIVKEHGGRVPRSVEALQKLPGIGYNTACATAAFAFNKPVVFIETNVRSVFIHHFFANRSGVRDEEIVPLLTQALDLKTPRRFYAALMDYGTTLKRTNSNPSRQSAHYVRQSRFEGSLRQLRGRAIAVLTRAGSVPPESLRAACHAPQPRFEQAIASLLRDGLIVKRRRVFSITKSI